MVLLSKLVNFQVYSNQLTGTIPSFIGQMSSLSYLFLFNNLLNGKDFFVFLAIIFFLGTIPSVLGQLTKLNQLMLHTNKFTGTIPTSIGDLSSLSLLYLMGNLLTGIIFSTMHMVYFLRKDSDLGW